MKLKIGKKIFQCISIITFVMIIGNISANAATSGTTLATVEITSGTLDMLNVTSSVNFGTVIVDGTIKTVHANLSPLTVSDLRGIGNGWNVTVSASPFTQTGGAITPLVFETNTFRLNGIDAITQTNGSSGLPVSAGVSPWVIDNGAVKILTAANGSGMGEYEVTFPTNSLSLTVDTAKSLIDPLNTPTVYESTITWQVNVGP